MTIGSRLDEVVDFIRRNRDKKVAVLVSGDPGLYSFLSYLLKHFDPGELEVIPGLSSVQVAFARAGMTWQDAVIVSLHGRNKERVLSEVVLPAVKGGSKVALLTDSGLTPQDIAAYLVERGVVHREMIVGDNLTCPGEKLVTASLQEMIQSRERFDNCVVLIVDGRR